jgi:hypothetical protein
MARKDLEVQFHIGTRGDGTDLGYEGGNLGSGKGKEDRVAQRNLNFIGLGEGARHDVTGRNVTRQRIADIRRVVALIFPTKGTSWT